eukprot:scaffold211_cov443-Pavlova_lutheri.AAC.1
MGHKAHVKLAQPQKGHVFSLGLRACKVLDLRHQVGCTSQLTVANAKANPFQSASEEVAFR